VWGRRYRTVVDEGAWSASPIGVSQEAQSRRVSGTHPARSSATRTTRVVLRAERRLRGEGEEGDGHSSQRSARAGRRPIPAFRRIVQHAVSPERPQLSQWLHEDLLRRSTIGREAARLYRARGGCERLEIAPPRVRARPWSCTPRDDEWSRGEESRAARPLFRTRPWSCSSQRITS